MQVTEKDFRQLKDLRTPEEWIENALLIPQKKNKPPFLFRPSVIGAAASLLIIATAALTLFLTGYARKHGIKEADPGSIRWE